MTLNEMNKIEKVMRGKLLSMLDKANGELKVLLEQETSVIDSGFVPNNHWQARWQVQQKIKTIWDVLDALD